MATGTGVETRVRTQNGNVYGSGDGHESSKVDVNEYEDRNGDVKDNRIGEGGV